MKKGPVARALFHEQRSPLRLILLAAYILLLAFVLLLALLTLLALLLARLLSGLGLILPFLLLALLTLLTLLARLAALVASHNSKSSWMGFSQPTI